MTLKKIYLRSKKSNNLLKEKNQHLKAENIQNKNKSKVEKTKNASNLKDLRTKIKKLQTGLSKANRKSAETIKEINNLKHQINKDTDTNGTRNTIDVSINGDVHIRKNNGNEERFLDGFVGFKKFVTLEFQNINQNIANLNMKDQYSQRNILYEEQKKWKEANNSSKINKNSTKRY